MTSTSLNSVSMQKPNNVSTHSSKFLHLGSFGSCRCGSEGSGKGVSDVLKYGQWGSAPCAGIQAVIQAIECLHTLYIASPMFTTSHSVLFNHAANAPLPFIYTTKTIPTFLAVEIQQANQLYTFGQGAKASSLSLSCCSSSLKWLVRSFNSLFSTCKPRFEHETKMEDTFGSGFPAKISKNLYKKTLKTYQAIRI